MSTFRNIAALAERRAQKEIDSGGRLKEILEIVAKNDIRDGLTPLKAVKILQDLGPTFVKLGQIASTHPDILPVEYCDALGELRANVEPMPVDTVRSRIESELGAPVETLFSEFDDTALGSASIGQVHRAVVRATGKEVAVKIQRPDVLETVMRDLALMKRVVAVQDLLVHGQGQISLKELVDELERTTRDELFYSVEAANLMRFSANNAGRALVDSPKCYPELSTDAVLTMDFARGPRIASVGELGLTDKQRSDLAYLVAQNYVEQVLNDGFFHADPHAGNILLTGTDRPQGAIGIEWIDFGMMGTLPTSTREALSEIVGAIVKGDAYALKRGVFKIATPTGPVDHGALLNICEQMVDQFVDVDLEEFDTGKLMETLLAAMKGQGFDIDPSVMMLGRGLVTLEGTIHLVSPKLNIMEVVSRYAASSFDPKVVQARARKFMSASIESVEASVTLPTKASETLDMLQKGHLRLHMDLGAEANFATELRKGLDHFSMVIIAAALFLGACVMCLTDMAPRVFGVPLLGLIASLAGLLIMAYVLFDIIRNRRR